MTVDAVNVNTVEDNKHAAEPKFQSSVTSEPDNHNQLWDWSFTALWWMSDSKYWYVASGNHYTDFTLYSDNIETRENQKKEKGVSLTNFQNQCGHPA